MISFIKNLFNHKIPNIPECQPTPEKEIDPDWCVNCQAYHPSTQICADQIGQATESPIKCPYCGGVDFIEGPSGGLSVNVLCSNPDCRHWFNFTLNRLEDLGRVEPLPEDVDREHEEEIARLEEASQLYYEKIYKDGQSLYKTEKHAIDCLICTDSYDQTGMHNNNIRLAGFIDAMCEDLNI